MRTVRWRGSYDPGLSAKKTIDLGDSIADSVEEDDVFWSDLRAAASVDLICKKFACRGDSGRIAVSPSRLGLNDFLNDLANPRLNLFAFLDGIADIFPCDLDTESFEAMTDFDNLTNRVCQRPRTLVDNVPSHVAPSTAVCDGLFVARSGELVYDSITGEGLKSLGNLH